MPTLRQSSLSLLRCHLQVSRRLESLTNLLAASFINFLSRPFNRWKKLAKPSALKSTNPHSLPSRSQTPWKTPSESSVNFPKAGILNFSTMKWSLPRPTPKSKCSSDPWKRENTPAYWKYSGNNSKPNATKSKESGSSLSLLRKSRWRLPAGLLAWRS